MGKETAMLPNAVYRLMERLRQKGLVVVLDTHPVTFQAIPPQVGLEAFIQKQKQSLEQAKMFSLQAFASKTPRAPQTRIDIVSSRQMMFATYIKLLLNAKKEVLIISVGESVPDALKLANRDALERGIAIKFITHVSDERNKELLRSWVHMGLEVRHYPDSGFHVMVFDGKQSILAANNPQNIAERTSMVIYSEGISRALHDYFFSLWQKAIPIIE